MVMKDVETGVEKSQALLNSDGRNPLGYDMGASTSSTTESTSEPKTEKLLEAMVGSCREIVEAKIISLQHSFGNTSIEVAFTTH